MQLKLSNEIFTNGQASDSKPSNSNDGLLRASDGYKSLASANIRTLPQNSIDFSERNSINSKKFYEIGRIQDREKPRDSGYITM